MKTIDELSDAHLKEVLRTVKAGSLTSERMDAALAGVAR